jgi:hypothetical protein
VCTPPLEVGDHEDGERPRLLLRGQGRCAARLYEACEQFPDRCIVSKYNHSSISVMQV